MNAVTSQLGTATQRPGAAPVRIGRSDERGGRGDGATYTLIPSLLGALPRDVTRTEPGQPLPNVLAGLRVPTLMDLVVDRVAPGTPVGPGAPFRQPAPASPLDPRTFPPVGYAAASLETEAQAATLGAWWGQAIAGWAASGLSGVRLLGLDRVPDPLLGPLLSAMRSASGEAVLFAWTVGVSWAALDGTVPGSVDLVALSAPTWDGEAEWFWTLRDKLRRVAPVVVADPDPRSLALADALGDGVLMDGAPPASAHASETQWATRLPVPAPVTAILRTDHPDPRQASRARLAVINVGGATARVPASALLVPTGGMLGAFTGPDGALEPGAFLSLPPGAVRDFTATRPAPSPPAPRSPATAAARQPRLSIEAVSPAVEAGQFPARRVVGEFVTVAADVVGDGHDKLAAVLRWQAPGEASWTEVRMTLLGNDRFGAGFPLRTLGVHRFAVSAWRDAFATYQDELGKKFAAGVPVALELKEGMLHVEHALHAAAGDLAAKLRSLLDTLQDADADGQRVLLLSAATTELLRQADPRPYAATSVEFPVQAERTAARFASWYEVFPRSLSDDESRHGTWADVQRHLPRVRAMGFDVLYFPPFHPIGRTHRKGRNNSLNAGPDDPGSPYAIGSEAGGHDALHPELGTREEFQAMRRAAADHGIELAMDFAIQCSPDHPWLKQHRDWFQWRPDGSIRYAENPPKKYEDIVNVDFYAPGAMPGLWNALCDVVLFWAEQGIRLFRVDNPHTKPLPFWQWLIDAVQARFPDAVFLAEAFTRPKVMYQLAKVGFSQSYTYFTWRNTKSEFEQYLTELTQDAPREFFRPHFFVNTPDINPVMLQTSGRPGFLIRAALAATLSGLWGVYNGFELCEGTPVPGKEEYFDSEKYQLRKWDWNRPGNIVAEVTQLNRIRRENPALQSHLGIAFLTAYDERVLFFEKASDDGTNTVLAAILLDHTATTDCELEFPFWRYGATEAAPIALDDLLAGTRLAWTGKHQAIRLTPDHPYAIWRVHPAA